MGCDCLLFVFFFFKQKTAYEMRISDWSSDVCSSDLKPYMVEPLDKHDLNEVEADGVPASSPLDAEDQFDPAFVDAIIERLDEGDTARAQELVEQLHPATIADLLALPDRDHRRQPAAALGSRLDGDGLAEMNHGVRRK